MDVTPAERSQLASILRCKENEVDGKFATYQAAASEEYLRMILGQRVYTRGTDVREYRLLLLMKHVFKGMPTEAQVSALFQTTATQSRGLLRAVLSKYQYELHEIVTGSLRRALEQAKDDPNGDGKILVTASDNLIENLNRTIATVDGTLQQISKVRGTASTYEIDKGSYKALEEWLAK
jgi:hypothetical protein